MNPDVARAIPELLRSGIIERKTADTLLRLARGELLSVRSEIRLLFYLGVLLTAAGAGLLIAENYRHIGPVAVALTVGIGAVSSFVLAARQSPGFSWDEVQSPSLAYDYLLLLGVLLGAADLAFIEVQFTPLGSNWPWHLLITSLLMAWIAVRYDSRTVFSLALSTFAAWRGLSVSLIEKPIWHFSSEPVRWNAISCGLLFIFLGHFLTRTRKKPHFAPVAAYTGWLLVLGALISGGFEHGLKGVIYILLLLGAGCGLALHYFKKRSFVLFAAGVLAVFIAWCEAVGRMQLISGRDTFVLRSLLIAIAALALVALLWRTHRRMKEPL